MYNDSNLFSGLCAQGQLPFVEIRKFDSQYARKNTIIPKEKQKFRSQQQHKIARLKSDKIKKQYTRICKEMKSNHSPTRHSDRKSEQIKKLVIHQSSNGRPQIFGKVLPMKKQETQPSECLSPSNPFQYALEALKLKHRHLVTSNNQFPQKISPSHRYGKKLKPLSHYLMKHFESEGLSIERINLHIKNIEQKDYLQEKQSEDRYRQEYKSQNSFNRNGKLQENPDFISKSIMINATRCSQQLQTQEKVKRNTQANNSQPKSLCSNNQQEIKKKKTNNHLKKKVVYQKKFVPPFETYYYRDLIWRFNLSNQVMIETPLEYEHRLRVYIGKGNNSGLLRGLIKRRIWFAITDRIEQANFVWVQLKHLPYYNHQKQWVKEISKIECRLKDHKIEGSSLYNQLETQTWNDYLGYSQKIEERQDQRLNYRHKYFGQQKYCSEQPLNSECPLKVRTIIKSVTEIRQQKVQNHFKNNYIIGNKKTLFKTMAVYYKNRDDYVFNYLPYTFHIKEGMEDQSYYKFLKFYFQRGKQIRANNPKANENQGNVWIVKPGEYSNRGYGIKVCKNIDDVKAIIKKKQRLNDGSLRTYIVQAYLEKPLLYNKRKFDLRHFMMITCNNGIMKGYWYREGYVRTSASQYSVSSLQSKIHLTNDAIQKNMAQYGRFQKGNKISYEQLHQYIQKMYGYKNYNFKEIILPKMKKITTDIIKACSGSIDPNFHGNNFQIFGLDFMIDADFNVWLIEVNTNPCLEINCPLLGSIIPKMIQNSLELTLDCMFPPPVRYTPKGIHYTKNLTEQNKFDLIYDSRIDGINRQSIDVIDQSLLKEEDEVFEDDGEQWDQDD